MLATFTPAPAPRHPSALMLAGTWTWPYRVDVPSSVRDAASRYRWGRGDMQIHAALREPLQWRDGRLNDVPLVHLTPGLNGVRKAVGEARRSVLPARPTIAAGQPTILGSVPCAEWLRGAVDPVARNPVPAGRRLR